MLFSKRHYICEGSIYHLNTFGLPSETIKMLIAIMSESFQVRRDRCLIRVISDDIKVLIQGNIEVHSDQCFLSL